MDLSFTAPRQLEAGRGIEGFHCGVEVVDRWVTAHSSKARAQGTSIIYATFCDDVVAGFYTLSAYAVRRASISGGWLARNIPESVPAILLGMLAVDMRFQHRGLGPQLLRDAILRSASAASIIGARALIVDPATDGARSFYERYGFVDVPGTDRLYVRLT